MNLENFAGFGISGYRSYGDSDHIEYFGPFSRVHLIVGRNNSGKSNALHFLADTLTALRDTNGTLSADQLYPGSHDLPDDWSREKPTMISIGLHLTDEVANHLRLDNQIIQMWLSTDAYTRGIPGTVWFDLNVSPPTRPANQISVTLDEAQVLRAARENTGFTVESLADISMLLTSSSSSNSPANAKRIVDVLAPWQWIPQVEWVDAIRQLTATGDENWRNGSGLIPELGRLERPAYATRTEDRAKFQALQRFVKDVLEDPDAEVQVPDAKDTLHVVTRWGAKELDAVGTGISEVIFIAAVASISDQKLLCIEEPEVHLHPTLQRKLIAHLHRNTTNNYLMSTHSAAMLDAELASISHVEMKERWSSATSVLSRSDISGAVSDLGNRASDLVQSNYIVLG